MVGGLRVVEYHAGIGEWWLEAAPLLKDADVVILHGMDIGMARSDQQHTTRLLAYFLGMNYAWGLVFVELSAGTKRERASAEEIPNFHGLHGNAFLARCKITDPMLFRNPVGSGIKPRLGGRMAMLGRIAVNGTAVVIGNIQESGGFRSEIRGYLGGVFLFTFRGFWWLSSAFRPSNQ
jgi:hypothetical protein